MRNTHKIRCSIGGFRCRLVAGLGFAFLLAAPPAIQAGSGQSSWAAIEDDRGITLVPVLACRTRNALARVSSSGPENWGVFVRLFVEQGECTRLPQYTSIILIDRTLEALHVRTAGLGRLWVSQTTRVPGLAEMALGGRLKEESSEPAPASGLTDDEQKAVDAQLAEKETVSEFAGRARIGRRTGGSRGDSSDTKRRSCRCTNGKTITAFRPCDEACDVQASIGSNEVDKKGCHFHGELMDCRESGRRKAEERLRRGY